MQKWEYCAITNIKAGGHQGLRGAYDWFVLCEFAQEGQNPVVTGNKKDSQKKLGSAIAKLGLDGWEMVGCVDDQYGHIIYFKRPLSE